MDFKTKQFLKFSNKNMCFNAVGKRETVIVVFAWETKSENLTAHSIASVGKYFAAQN